MELGSPEMATSQLGAVAEITAWENTQNVGNNGGGSRLQGGGEASFQQPEARQGRREPPPRLI